MIIIIIILLLVLVIYKINNKDLFTDFDRYHHIYYINLDSRPDRNKLMINQLRHANKNKKFKINRFSAIKNSIHGGIGCGQSHIKILKIAKKLNLPYVIIIEDDIQIKHNLEKYINQIKMLNNWDIVLLAGHGEYKHYNDVFHKADGIQTTGCYVIKRHYYDTLINKFQESVDNMISLHKQNKDIQYDRWAIDQNWKQLQIKDNWFVFKEKIGIQRTGYSDIEHRIIDHKSLDEKRKLRMKMII